MFAKATAPQLWSLSAKAVGVGAGVSDFTNSLVVLICQAGGREQL